MSPLFRLLVRRHWWTCGICLLLPLGLGIVLGFIYPLFDRERATFGPLFEMVRKWFSDIPDFLSPEGAFVWPYMHPMTLMTYALAPAIPCLALPAGERGRGSLDLLLATPLSRKRLVVSIVSFMVPVNLAMALAPFLGALAGSAIAGAFEEIPIGAYALASVEAFALSFFLGSFALLLSVHARDRGQATLIFAASCFAMFLVDLLSMVWKGQGWWVARLGPLGYYHPLKFAHGESVPMVWDLLVLLGLGSVFVAWAVARQDTRRSA